MNLAKYRPEKIILDFIWSYWMIKYKFESRSKCKNELIRLNIGKIMTNYSGILKVTIILKMLQNKSKSLKFIVKIFFMK